jgi:hypothetical protein
MAMVLTPARPLSLREEMRVMRRACPGLVPKATAPPRRSDVGAVCSADERGTVVSLASSRCRDGEWSYIAGSGTPPGVPTGQTVQWLDPPGPPWFVHVDITASRDVDPCAWPRVRSEPALSDRLLGDARSSAVSLGGVMWSGERGQLILAPAYPRGGEVGGHLEFCYSAEGVHYAVTLHAWTSVFRFTVNGAHKTLVLHAGSSSATVIATLRRIVTSAHGA